MTVFQPKNKSLYVGKAGRSLMSFAGRECVVEGEKTYPAEHCKDRKPMPVVFIRFPNHATTFQVRPQDLSGREVGRS